MIIIRTKLKKTREDLGFTQESFGKEINISKGAYAQIELGIRIGSVKTWLNIQKAMCLSNDELVEMMKEGL